MLHLRLLGQESTLVVEYGDGVDVSEAFVARYEEMFRHRPTQMAIEVESLRVVAPRVCL